MKYFITYQFNLLHINILLHINSFHVISKFIPHPLRNPRESKKLTPVSVCAETKGVIIK